MLTALLSARNEISMGWVYSEKFLFHGDSNGCNHWINWDWAFSQNWIYSAHQLSIKTPLFNKTAEYKGVKTTMNVSLFR